VKVDPRDGACRSCGGVLEITDADDATMTVVCTEPECGDSYSLEPDAFGDGCLDDVVPFLIKQAEEGDDDE
jgi:hypothetical protein